MLGVDGGGSKTLARLAQAHTRGLLCAAGEGLGAASNPLSVGWDASQRELTTAVRAALDSAGLAPDACADSAVLAVAGCADPAVADRLREWAASQGFARRVRVVDDRAPLLAAADLGSPAIGVIAGTGSSCVGRTASGELHAIGGWGYLIDDAGSGYELGRACLRRVTRAADDAVSGSDPLSEAALRHAGATHVADLKAMVYGSDSPRTYIAGFAAPTLAMATTGDPAAAAIASSGAGELETLILTAWRRIGEPDPAGVSVLLSGGLLERSAHYRRLLTGRLVDRGWSADSIRLAPDPATGCCLLAARESST